MERRRRGGGNEKRIKICYIQVPTSHEECDCYNCKNAPQNQKPNKWNKTKTWKESQQLLHQPLSQHWYNECLFYSSAQFVPRIQLHALVSFYQDSIHILFFMLFFSYSIIYHVCILCSDVIINRNIQNKTYYLIHIPTMKEYYTRQY